MFLRVQVAGGSCEGSGMVSERRHFEAPLCGSQKRMAHQICIRLLVASKGALGDGRRVADRNVTVHSLKVLI